MRCTPAMVRSRPHTHFPPPPLHLLIEPRKQRVSWPRSVLKSAPMAFTFPSPEWATEFKKQVDASPAYRQAAATWTFGPVALLTKADPSIGLAEDVGMWLDI